MNYRSFICKLYKYRVRKLLEKTRQRKSWMNKNAWKKVTKEPRIQIRSGKVNKIVVEHDSSLLEEKVQRICHILSIDDVNADLPQVYNLRYTWYPFVTFST